MAWYWTWTKDGLIYKCIYASLGLKELTIHGDFHPFDNCCFVKLWMNDHFVYVVYECLQETIKHLFIYLSLSILNID